MFSVMCAGGENGGADAHYDMNPGQGRWRLSSVWLRALQGSNIRGLVVLGFGGLWFLFLTEGLLDLGL